ncbi:MAG: glycosyltransferase [Deltaproteobacteria bacterium]|nr:glycosyltransferase [Deltaproteobacteria bacterium]
MNDPVPEGIRPKDVELSADIVVGIPSYNNSRTISHVVKAVDAGLGKYFPGDKAVIINSDGGSKDNTPEAVINTRVDHKAIFLTHRLYPVNRITTPYHGIPGKGSAFRTIFQMAVDLGAKACCVVDADLRSITPEWIELLLAPILQEGFDFVAPLYTRHKYDGTITNSIIYPVTRSLYGKRIRQPIGGEFGFSGRMAGYYLSQDVWDSDVARFGIDIWMTTEAIAGNFNICQSYLGAKIHDPKDPGADLKDMFVQVAGSLLTLTEKHYKEWKDVTLSKDVQTFGFKYSAGVVPVKLNIERMISAFRIGVNNLKDVWARVIPGDTILSLEEISRRESNDFRFPKELWVSIIYEYILAFHHKRLSDDHLLKSLLPLYFGRTASFSLEVENLSDDEAEDEVERVCAEFENQKGYLQKNW